MFRLFGLILAVSALFVLGGIFSAEAAILRDLQRGARGAEVRELQQILNRDPETQIAASGPGSPGNETEYFGVLTKNAVKRFQQKYAREILTPLGLSMPTGFVGAKTRAALARFALPAAKTDMLPPPNPPPAQNSATRPRITSITPSTITESPQQITIIGENFTAAGNEIIVSSEGPYAYATAASQDAKTLSFTLRVSVAEAIKAQFKDNPNRSDIIKAVLQNMRIGEAPGIATTQIPIVVVVRNANGESSTAPLILDMASILQK